ncbi:hypothetical protein [Streptomyces caniferus]|uniref:hypothetical protein n=1 Tax=Streptomyces caniferus TaxID=285557 RepID=UPI0037FBF5B1
MSDVFSRRVRQINRAGVRFSVMESRCYKASPNHWRSAAWFNNNANYLMETPPAPKYLPGVAKVLRVSERRAAEMVAEQWYGVRPDDEVPEHLRELVALMRGVDPADVPLIEQVVQALSDKHTAEMQVQSVTGDLQKKAWAV